MRISWVNHIGTAHQASRWTIPDKLSVFHYVLYVFAGSGTGDDGANNWRGIYGKIEMRASNRPGDPVMG